MDELDLEQLKDNIDLLSYITELGYTATRVGSNKHWINPCPVCGHKDHFTVYPETNSYSSFSGCCEGGSILDFVCAYEDVTLATAIEKLSGGKHTFSQRTFTSEPVKPVKTVDYTWLIEKSYLEVYKTDYYKSRGLSKRIIDKYKLGYMEAGHKWHGELYKFILPVTKNFVIFRCDSNDNKQKYRNSSGLSQMLNSQYITDDKLKYVFVTEGFFDALSIEELGYNAIALNSTSNIDTLIEKITVLKPSNKVLIFAMDNDKAGIRAKEKVKQLQGIVNVQFLNIPQQFKDLNEVLIGNKNMLVKLTNLVIRKCLF